MTDSNIKNNVCTVCICDISYVYKFVFLWWCKWLCTLWISWFCSCNIYFTSSSIYKFWFHQRNFTFFFPLQILWKINHLHIYMLLSQYNYSSFSFQNKEKYTWFSNHQGKNFPDVRFLYTRLNSGAQIRKIKRSHWNTKQYNVVCIDIYETILSLTTNQSRSTYWLKFQRNMHGDMMSL